jgi:hypothetical protein
VSPLVEHGHCSIGALTVPIRLGPTLPVLGPYTLC